MQGVLSVSLSELKARRLRGRRGWAGCGRPGKGVSKRLRGMGGHGGRGCQPRGPDHLSKSALEFPRVLKAVYHIAVESTDLGVRLSGFKF